MIALSIRQPWAWLIVRPDLTDSEARAEAARNFDLKDIENRNWSTPFRGRCLVHAGQTCTRREFDDARAFAAEEMNIDIPSLDELPRGGIVGSVEIVDCVDDSDSPWFFGTYGFVLARPVALPFVPWKGRLGFFNVPETAVHSRTAGLA